MLLRLILEKFDVRDESKRRQLRAAFKAQHEDIRQAISESEKAEKSARLILQKSRARRLTLKT